MGPSHPLVHRSVLYALHLVVFANVMACDERENQEKVDAAFTRCMAKVPPGAERATVPPVASNPHVYRKNSDPGPSVEEQRALYQKALAIRRVCETMRAECRRGYFTIQCQAELNSNGQ